MTEKRDVPSLIPAAACSHGNDDFPETRNRNPETEEFPRNSSLPNHSNSVIKPWGAKQTKTKGGNVPGGSPKPGNPYSVICIALAALMLTSCATLQSDLPSCSNVRGYYNPDIPVGAERLGSRLWIERHLIYTSQIGSVVRAVAAGPADGEWQATRMRTPLLVEDGLWKTTVPTGIASQHPYDVNFDARAWEEPQFTTARFQRRTVEIYVHAFGPHFGNYGLERTLRMAALKYRGAPDTDWAICPVRL